MKDTFELATLGVRAGQARTEFNENSEALFLTSSFVSDNARQAAAAAARQLVGPFGGQPDRGLGAVEGGPVHRGTGASGRGEGWWCDLRGSCENGVFADDEYQTVGGHVKDLVAGATVELFIHRSHQPMRRKHDDDTGLQLLDLK